MDDNRVIVAGAGLAGLAAATALRHAGIPTTVFERVPQMGPVGAIIGVTHRAASELERAGRGDLVASACIPVQGIEYYSWKGKKLTRMPIAEASQATGTKTFITMRADVQLGLYEALEPGVVQVGSEVSGYSEDGGGVTVSLADGREERGMALLGADGIHSVVRKKLRGDQPTYTGYMAWRGVVEQDPLPIEPGVANQLLGRGRTCGAFGLSRNRLYWFVTALMEPHGRDSQAGRKADVLKAFAGGPEFIRKAIEATPESAILRSDVFYWPPAESWGSGRVTILGDSAHATSPATGEGGSHAILDGAGVANALASVADRLDDAGAVSSALREYEREAIARTSAGVQRAVGMGKRLHASNPVQCLVRDLVFRLTPERTWLKRAKFYLSPEG
ncbi:MAG TPA: FAD-dependent monooxygenase [Solirubrobacteraceae bacterium]|jgi:2-polyprenyl-6-methoxyphenol hydroxylase-like FAD-dependent oxidoreductase